MYNSSVSRPSEFLIYLQIFVVGQEMEVAPQPLVQPQLKQVVPPPLVQAQTRPPQQVLLALPHHLHRRRTY